MLIKEFGVLLMKSDASLDAFFHAVGGELTEEEIKFPAGQGLLSSKNGELCNDKLAKLYVFVNGEPIEKHADYVIAPYENVPPGDKIKIVFTEKPITEINPHIK